MRRTLMLGAAMMLFGAMPLGGCIGSEDELKKFGINDIDTACAPGQQVACACPGGVSTGVQICNGQGTGYSPCECAPLGSGGSGGTSGASCTVFPDCDDCVDCFESCVCQSSGHVNECLDTCGLSGGGGSSGTCNPGSCPPPAFAQAGEACCTDTDSCGIRITFLGQGCLPPDAPGQLDSECPDQTLMSIPLRGCCKPDGVCGYMDTFLGLGCVDPSQFGQPSQSCNP